MTRSGTPTADSLETGDLVEITMLVSRLCQSLDYSRPQAFVDVFVPDGVYQAVSSTATGEEARFRHQGAAQLLEFAESAVAKRQGLGRHWTGNLVVDGAGDHATGTSYVLFLQIDPDTKERRITISGTHRDVFVRTPEGWRFESRTVVADI
jgi:hypothetical protein